MPVQKSNRPTLRTISELSGFAVPTVSRALKGAPDIGKSTQETVQRIARDIGYVPNRAGVRLKTGKTNVIALVLSTEHDMLNHTGRLISAFAGKLRETNYHVIVTPYFPDEDPMIPVTYVVETGSADAVILNQTQPEDVRVRYLMDQNFPFATHGRTKWSHLHPYFDFDNSKYGSYSVERLHQRGRKNLLLIAPPPGQTYARYMIEGSLEMADTLGIKMKLLESATSDDPSDVVRAAVEAHMTDETSVDGIVCGSTTAAMAAVAAVEDFDFKVGRDVDIVAKEAEEFLSLFRPDILSFRENVSRAAEFLAEAAIQAINQPDLPPLQELDFPKLIA
ncbi:LacI family transcriptional regulator [Rhodobacteraceae bacterium]|nr:LacI family transcriptional regulator [Paracoccaceae bacterium]